MKCLVCEGNRLRVEILQEEIHFLKQKHAELERINSTLTKALQNCSGNQDWKIKYEVIFEQLNKLESQRRKSKVMKDASKDKHNDCLPLHRTPLQQRNKSQLKEQAIVHGYSTPKNKRVERSCSAKMQTFISTLKKNLSQAIHSETIYQPASRCFTVQRNSHQNLQQRKTKQHKQLLEKPYYNEKWNESKGIECQSKPYKYSLFKVDDQCVRTNKVGVFKRPKTLIQIFAFDSIK